MNEISIPNGILEESASSYETRVQRQKYRKTYAQDTAVFKYKDAALVVGREAIESGRPVTITGPDKYVEGVLDRMVIAALLNLVPAGYRNIVVACAHTTNATPYIDKMAKIVGGSHEVQNYEGKLVKYSIRAFIPWDEPIGGMWRYISTTQHEIEQGESIIVIDIGGKISSMYPVEMMPNKQPNVYWSQGQSFNSGIQDIKASLETELRALHPDIFTGKSIPDSILTESLRTFTLEKVGDKDVVRHWAKIRGNKMDVTEAVLNSVSPLLRQISNVYVNNLNSGLVASRIIITGGGGGLLSEVMKTQILNHDYVYLADDLSSIQFANLRGGEFATSAWVTQHNVELRRPLQNKVSFLDPLVMVIDPGNSDIKAKLMSSAEWKPSYA